MLGLDPVLPGSVDTDAGGGSGPTDPVHLSQVRNTYFKHTTRWAAWLCPVSYR